MSVLRGDSERKDLLSVDLANYSVDGVLCRLIVSV